MLIVSISGKVALKIPTKSIFVFFRALVFKKAEAQAAIAVPILHVLKCPLSVNLGA